MTIKYDNYIKKPNQETEYTPEMIKEIEKCSNDSEYFFINYVKIQHPDKGMISLELYPHQQRMLKTIHKNRMSIVKTPRQYGKTSFCAAYILWFTCFNNDKTSGIVSNQQSSAIEVLDRMKTMYESVPLWLKPGVHNYAKTMVSFDNGSRVIAAATSKNSFRGWTINGICLCDEFCHVSKNLQSEFWSSNYPTITSSKHAKMVLISTPLGMHDLFYKIWINAENNKNNFNIVNVHWSEHPERDEKWLEEQRQILGERLWKQEVLTEFLGSTSTVIDPDVLEKLLLNTKDPIQYDLNNKLRIWELPQKGELYIIGTDISKGTGEHYSTCQVLKVTSINPFKAKQVAVFQDNYTDVYQFSNIIYRLAVYYNNAYLVVENNIGDTVISQLWWEFEYGNLLCEGSKSTQLGVRATTKTKPKAVLSMKKLIENGDLILYDEPTVNELTSFIDKGNNTFAGKDLTDDLVSALYWACYITQFDILEDGEFKINNEVEDEAWGILSDVEESEVNFGWIID